MENLKFEIEKWNWNHTGLWQTNIPSPNLRALGGFVINLWTKKKKKTSCLLAGALYFVTILCLFFFSYDNVLDPADHITCAFDLRNEKRHLFEIPNPHSNLDLDEYEYEDDFEWQQKYRSPSGSV